MTSRTAPFRFKRFTIHQDRAAMKVGFDGILLGAWSDISRCDRILDVGTGTGLIALMLAQRTECAAGHDAQIDAVEIDQAAAQEAEVNMVNSPWTSRVRVWQGPVQQFPLTCPYDLIVCNPPYFERSLRSPDRSRTRARHDGELTFGLLCKLAVRVLDSRGKLCVSLPAERHERCLALARDHALFCRRIMRVKPLPHRPAKRMLLELQRQDGPVEDSAITLELRHHCYTDEFRSLTKDFYLSL